MAVVGTNIIAAASNSGGGSGSSGAGGSGNGQALNAEVRGRGRKEGRDTEARQLSERRREDRHFPFFIFHTANDS